MKKTILGVLAALLLAPLAAGAQNIQKIRKTVATLQTDNLANPPAVEKTQSAGLGLSVIPLGVNLNYTYEHPLGRLGSIIGRAGLDVGGGWGYSTFGGSWGYFAVAPSIEIEPRFYYGLDRREAHGRSTAGNAGSFLGLNIKNAFPFGYISDRDLRLIGSTIFTPQWGLRRVWREHWQFEFTAGIGFHVAWSSDAFALPGAYLSDNASCYPSVGVKFGYAF
jgi:hypothetical protein